MKRLILIIISIMMLVTAGCGSEVSVVVPIPIPIFIVTPPSITAYQFTQDSVNYFVNGSVDYYAPDFDLDTITISATNSFGVVTERTVTSLVGVNGRTTGTITFSIDYLKYRPDVYTFTVYLTDKAGYMSNPIYEAFRL